MMTPQPAATPALQTATPPPATPTPPRIPALFGVIGGALAIAGFFLPWSAILNAEQGQPLGYGTASGWDIANRLLNPPTTGGGPIPGLTYGPGYFYAILVAVPAILALVALVVGGLSFFRSPNPVMVGLYTAAGTLGAFGVLNVYPTFLLTLGSSTSGIVPSNSSTAGLGVILLFLGYFGIVSGGFMALAQARRS